MHLVGAVDVLDRAANVVGGDQAMVNADATNDEHAVLRFDLATHVAGERPSTCPDLPRCQRGGKGAL